MASRSLPFHRRLRRRVCLGLGALASIGGCGRSEPAAPPNVVLVSMDTLRADRLGAYGNERGLSPNLDAFAEEAVLFERAYAQSNITLLSHASLFTGRYASELGPVDYDLRLPEQAPDLAEVLGLYGWETAAFVGGAHLSPGFGFADDFDHYRVPTQMGSLFHTVPAAIQWLDERTTDDPFFLFVHAYDTHTRYIKPTPLGLSQAEPGYQGPAMRILYTYPGIRHAMADWLIERGEVLEHWDLDRIRVWDRRVREEMRAAARAGRVPGEPLEPEDIQFVRDVYDGAVLYADAFFGVLLGELRARGLYENTLVVMLSDHGESLGEEGIFGHSYSLRDDDLHVPLVIRFPEGRGGGRRVAGPVALLDVLPTVLDEADVPPPAGIHGHSLRPWSQGGGGPLHEHVFTEGLFRAVSVRSDRERVTFAGIPADSPYLVGMIRSTPRTSEAWGASTPTDPAAWAAGRDALLAWRRALPPAPENTLQADPELVDQVREKGYWGTP